MYLQILILPQAYTWYCKNLLWALPWTGRGGPEAGSTHIPAHSRHVPTQASWGIRGHTAYIFLRSQCRLLWWVHSAHWSPLAVGCQEPRPRQGWSILSWIWMTLFRSDAGNSPGSVILQEAPHPTWLTGSKCQEGDSWAGQGRGVVLPNTTTKHWSLQIHTWYWVAHSAHAEDTSLSPHWWLQKMYKPHHFTCFLF